MSSRFTWSKKLNSASAGVCPLQNWNNIYTKLYNQTSDCRIWGSHSGGYEEFYFLRCKAMQSTENQPTFHSNMSPLLAICFMLDSCFIHSSTQKVEQHVPLKCWSTLNGLTWYYISEDRSTLHSMNFFLLLTQEHNTRAGYVLIMLQCSISYINWGSTWFSVSPHEYMARALNRPRCLHPQSLTYIHARWALPRPFLYIHEFFQTRKIPFRTPFLYCSPLHRFNRITENKHAGSNSIPLDLYSAGVWFISWARHQLYSFLFCNFPVPLGKCQDSTSNWTFHTLSNSLTILLLDTM
jgi:hypothetical protein